MLSKSRDLSWGNRAQSISKRLVTFPTNNGVRSVDRWPFRHLNHLTSGQLGRSNCENHFDRIWYFHIPKNCRSHPEAQRNNSTSTHSKSLPLARAINDCFVFFTCNQMINPLHLLNVNRRLYVLWGTEK